MKNTATIWGFVAGAVAGAGIALLFAPDKGRATRRSLFSTDPMPPSTQEGEEKIRAVMHEAKAHQES